MTQNRGLSLKMHKRNKQTEVQIVNNYLKKYLTSLDIRKLQIKAVLKVHHNPERKAIIKNSNNRKSWWGIKGKGPLLHCWWECKLLQPTENQYQNSSKKKKKKPNNSMLVSYSPFRYSPQRVKDTILCLHVHMHVYSSTSYNR